MILINIMKAFPFVLLLSWNSTSNSFSASPSQSTLWDLLGSVQKSIFSGETKLKSPLEERRETLKTTLLSQISQKTISREQVEELISELADLSPIQNTAASPILQTKWLLAWTTEKEINFFLDWKLSQQISQTINSPLLENDIPFLRGGSFGVSGNLEIPDISGQRTNFQFTTATLDLGSWGSFSFPPIGEGWFDTIYLDSSLRVDINSRNDILICVPFPLNKD